MNRLFGVLVQRLDEAVRADTEVIPWSCPVPAFGDPTTSAVATLGLNPSNREFVDEKGKELDGVSRRFETLRSLGLSSWSNAGEDQLRLVFEACRSYFTKNPYDGWFKRLDRIISGTRTSYYQAGSSACHLDLIPFATAKKWGALSTQQRNSLLSIASDTLGLLLRDSAIRLLVLNGRSVIEHFQQMSGIQLHCQSMVAWALPRTEQCVAGYAYWAKIHSLSGVELGRDVVVLGFNHNIQSSFGVTSEVLAAIRNWIAWFSKGGA
jgi:hypothetical protein